MTTPRLTAALMAAILATSFAATAEAGKNGPLERPATAEAAQRAAVEFLLSQIGPRGACEGETAGDPQYGYKTALATYALLSSGTSSQNPQVRAAIEWLLRAKLTNVQAVAMRACALSELKDERSLAALKADAEWLVRAAAEDGAYAAESLGGGAASEYDNTDAQAAMLGVWRASRRGVEVEKSYWQRMEKYWTAQQQADGGWPYFVRPGVGQNKTYGSTTAGGLASLLICFERLHGEEFVRPAATAEPPAIAEGLGWLAKNFVADENPRVGNNRYYDWLFALERVGLLCGYKYFGPHNWYELGKAELVRRQNVEGSWDYGQQRVAQTSLALLFLSGGREPVAMNKLAYRGKWNARPADMANFASYLSYTFERPMRWQVLDIDAPLEEWQDSPILYISGSGAVEFTPEQAQKLRQFALRGGTIVSEAAGNSGDFTVDMQRLYRELFKPYAMERLSEESPAYTVQFKRKELAGLMCVSNGVRPLAIHSPRELSLAMQIGRGKGNDATLELAANLYSWLTDRGSVRTAPSWPAAKAMRARATIAVTRVKYDGNYDPEPLAWRRLAATMNHEQRARVTVSEPVAMDDLDAKAHPIAVLCGTDGFKLTAAQADVWRKYFREGGRLIAEACGGSRAFGESFEREILPLYPQGKYAELPLSHAIYRRPVAIDKVVYREEFAKSLGTAKNEPRLRAVLDGNRVVMVFSGEDVSEGLLGASVMGLKGYSPATAAALMTNVLCEMAGNHSR